MDNPEQLKELRQQCKTDHSKLGDVLCNRVAEATCKRFYGDGETPYIAPKKSPKTLIVDSSHCFQFPS